MSKVKVSLFSQVLNLVDRSLFNRLVSKHQSDKYSKGINTWTHFVSMLFMQMAQANSLRDISNGLRSATGNLVHLGVQRAPSKSSISYLNKHRSADFFEDLYFQLLDRLEPLIARRRVYAKRLKQKVFIMDSSVIPLCLSLFDWAKFRTKKGAIKLHAVLDYDSGLPSYAVISEGKTHDLLVAQQTVFPSGSVVVIDRGYLKYEWLNFLDSSGVIFVTRLHHDSAIECLREYDVPQEYEHLKEDIDIRMTGPLTSKKYPGKLRMVHVYDEVNKKDLYLLTNQMSWTADRISQLYKARWDIEIFFKHLKQLFRVKTFVGTSSNAVRIQMWCSMIAMLLLSLLKRQAKYRWNLANLITFLRINLFVKIDLWQWVNQPFIKKANAPPINQLF